MSLSNALIFVALVVGNVELLSVPQALQFSDLVGPPPPPPRGPPPPPTGAQCRCSEIVVSSNGEARKLHSHAMGVYRLSSSNFNAFKSTIYRNANGLALIGGKKQYWRINGGSRAGRIMIRQKSCKAACPTDCPIGWKAYKKPGYVKVKELKFECRNGDAINFP